MPQKPDTPMPPKTAKSAPFRLIVADSRPFGTPYGDYNYPPAKVLKNVFSGTPFAQSTNGRIKVFEAYNKVGEGKFSRTCNWTNKGGDQPCCR